MSSNRLTIYLMQEDVAEFDDAVSQEKQLTSIDTDDDTGVEGRFYFSASHTVQPRWVGYLNPILVAPIDGLRSASASGLLLSVRIRGFSRSRSATDAHS